MDAESAIQVIRFLQRYVKTAPGRRVILTIHQPSSFIWEMLDSIVLLAKGYLVYQGPRKDIKSFFNSCDCQTPEDYNPADYFLTVTNDDFDEKNKNPEWWTKAFSEWNVKKANRRESINSLQSMRSSVRGSVRSSLRGSILMNVDPVETHRGNFFHQVTELVRRYFTNLMLNPGILGVRVVMYAMLALIIGALFWKIGKKRATLYSTLILFNLLQLKTYHITPLLVISGDSSTYTSIQSRIALAFYCAAFFIFMSVAVMPFIIIERAIVEKEVRNGYYHPAVYQV